MCTRVTQLLGDKMAKNAVIRLSESAYKALSDMSKKQEKSMSSLASDIILSQKNDIDIERQKLRTELAELREDLRKMTTRKDLAALFYSLSKGVGTDVRKERLQLGYRMLLGHDVNVDFASVDVDNK
jgi:hypothetical protein